MTTTVNHPTGAPELVPARMLNEFTYCPRPLLHGVGAGGVRAQRGYGGWTLPTQAGGPADGRVAGAGPKWRVARG